MWLSQTGTDVCPTSLRTMWKLAAVNTQQGGNPQANWWEILKRSPGWRSQLPCWKVTPQGSRGQSRGVRFPLVAHLFPDCVNELEQIKRRPGWPRGRRCSSLAVDTAEKMAITHKLWISGGHYVTWIKGFYSPKHPGSHTLLKDEGVLVSLHWITRLVWFFMHLNVTKWPGSAVLRIKDHNCLFEATENFLTVWKVLKDLLWRGKAQSVMFSSRGSWMLLFAERINTKNQSPL